MRRLVKHRSEHRAPNSQASPRHVHILRRPVAAQIIHSAHRIRRMHGIGDATACHGTQQIVRQVRRSFVWPPGHHRSVRYQQWNHQRVRVVNQPANRTQHDDFARAGIGTESHFSIEEGAFLTIFHIHVSLARVRCNGNHTAGMFTAGVVRDFQIMFQRCFIRGDQQCEHATQSRFTTLLVQFVDFRRNLTGFGVLHGNDHGILQRCPSRASISTAS